MIVLAAKFTGRPERREDILHLAASMLPPSQAEAGCLTYQFYEQQPGSNEFLFFEEWAGQPALDAHFQTPHFLDFTTRFPELIQGKPLIRIYEVSKSHDL